MSSSELKLIRINRDFLLLFLYKQFFVSVQSINNYLDDFRVIFHVKRQELLKQFMIRSTKSCLRNIFWFIGVIWLPKSSIPYRKIECFWNPRPHQFMDTVICKKSAIFRHIRCNSDVHHCGWKGKDPFLYADETSHYTKGVLTEELEAKSMISYCCPSSKSWRNVS